MSIGHIYQRGKIWWVKMPPIIPGEKPEFQTSRDPSKGRDGTKREHAKSLLGELIAERKNERLEKALEAGRGDDPIVGDLLEFYLAHYTEGVQVGNGGGFDRAKLTVELLRPTFAEKRVSEITRKMLRAYRAKREAEGKQFPTINRELAILRSAMNRGLGEDLEFTMPKFPMVSEKNRARQNFIEAADYRRLWEEMPWTLRPLLLIGFHCGARIGEMCRIEWSDVDFEAKTILIRKTKNNESRSIPIYGEMGEFLRMWFDMRNRFFPRFPYVIFHFGGRGGGDIIEMMYNSMQRDVTRQAEIDRRIEILKAWDRGELRTGAAVAQLGVSDRAARDLRDQWRATGTVSSPLRKLTALGHNGEGPYVLRDSPMAYKDPYEAWDAACKRAGMADLNPHDLRRSAARNMDKANISRSLICKVLGWKSEAMFFRYRITRDSEAQLVGQMMEGRI